MKGNGFWTTIGKLCKEFPQIASLIVGIIVSLIVFLVGLNFEQTFFEKIIYFIISFFLPEVTAHNILQDKSVNDRLNDHEKKIDLQIKQLLENTESQNISSLSAVLEHLAKESFRNCSNYDNSCDGCENFCDNSKNYNSLLRNYLLEDCKKLSSSLENMEKGMYFLNTNIESYHEIAIQHMFASKCKFYGVIQTIGDKVPNTAPYDHLDYHFLNSLLIYIKKHAKENQDFKIKWLLIGDEKNMMNNYDYIFYVLNEMSESDRNTLKNFFKFYQMSTAKFIHKRQGDKPFGSLIHETTPSIGIFGDRFVFVDSLANTNEHGNIYTLQDRRVRSVFPFFDDLINDSRLLDYDNLTNQYNDLLKEYGDHEATLKNRWLKPEAK